MSTPRDGLRQRREELGITQEQLAVRLRVSTTTYRNWERGVYLPRVGQRPRLADELGVTVEEVGRWFGTDGQLTPKGMSVPAWLGHLATLEQGASRIHTYQPVVVPALLQTEAYATAVERAEPVSEEGALLRVKSRMQRQAVLSREPDPLELIVLLDESVLYRPAGDSAVMAAQLDHLASMSSWPTIDLRVIPLTAGLFSAAWGSFQILTSPDNSEPYMACAVDGVGARYLDRPGEVEAHESVFWRLSAVALSPSESRVFIEAVAQERYR